MSSYSVAPVRCSPRYSPPLPSLPGGWVGSVAESTSHRHGPRLNFVRLPSTSHDKGESSFNATSLRSRHASTSEAMERVDLWDSHRLVEHVVTSIFDESSAETSEAAAVTDFIESRRLGGQFFVFNHGRLDEMFDKADERQMAFAIEWSLQHLVHGTLPAVRIPKLYDVFSRASPKLQDTFPCTNDHKNESDDTTWDWPETQVSPQIRNALPGTDSGSATSSSPLTLITPTTEDPCVDVPAATLNLRAKMPLSPGLDADVQPQSYEAGKSFLPECKNITGSAVSTDVFLANADLPLTCEANTDMEAQDALCGSPRGDNDHLSPSFFTSSDLLDARLTTDEGPSQDDQDAAPADYDNLADFDTPSYGASELDAATSLESVGEDDFAPPFTSSPFSLHFMPLDGDGDDDLYTLPQGLPSIAEVDNNDDDVSIQPLPPSPGSAHSSLLSLQSHVTIVDLPTFDDTFDLEQELEPLLELEGALADTSALFPDPDMHHVATSRPEESAQEEHTSPMLVESQIDLLSPLKLNISSAELNLTEEVLLSPVLMKYTLNRMPAKTLTISTNLFIATPSPPSVPEGHHLLPRSRTLARALSEAMHPRTLFPTESGHRRARSLPAQPAECNTDGSTTTPTPAPRTVRFQLDNRARKGKERDERIPPLGHAAHRQKRIRSRTRASHAEDAAIRRDPELEPGNAKSRWSFLYALVSNLSADDSYFPLPDFVEAEGIPRHAFEVSAHILKLACFCGVLMQGVQVFHDRPMSGTMG
ncbi:hypothetical protein EVG20_g4237 [Dentipellis fragilis]|uniref:Uncharacterized protein n=1 Tax=Dentipellis fragilis TaxID=205917 RepID=A0A4Y9YW85_9AGAM|nr:hypothetical protein EVG20_g4237 [Dentipellis fragilis]